MPRVKPEKRPAKSFSLSYVAVAVFPPGKTSPTLLANQRGQVLVWDHIRYAQEWLPLLGCGRPYTLSPDKESIAFAWDSEDKDQISGAIILTEYDVYSLPPNHPVLSEARGLEWKKHQLIGEYMKEQGEIEKKRQRKALVARLLARINASRND